MAFTRSWDESTPTGSESASDIDLIIRNLKSDLRERLEDVSSFGTDTDPMTLDSDALDTPVGGGVTATYNADSASGSRVIKEEGAGSVLHCLVRGTTDGAGDITLDLGEFSDDLQAWTGQDISGDPVPGPITTGVMRTPAGGVQQFNIVVSGMTAAAGGAVSPGGTITFRVHNTNWTAIATTDVKFGMSYSWV